MTKRRWLKTAINEAKKPQVSLPWTRDRAAVAPVASVGKIAPQRNVASA